MANGRLEGRITVPSTGWSITIVENAGARTSSVTVASAGNEYYLSTVGDQSEGLLDAIGTALTADGTLTGTYTLSVSSSTGKVTITSDADDFAITWDYASLRDLLGWSANVSESAATYTSPKHAESLWLPDCGWSTKYGDIAGWWETDKHDAESASGYGWSYKGSEKRLNQILWSSVSRNKVLAAKEDIAGESFETFWRDCINGDEDWGTVGGPVRWYPDTDGQNNSIYYTYRVHGMESFQPEAQVANWVGRYAIELPRLLQVPGEYSNTIANSISQILDHSDPMQALIDLMGLGTKPDYMWGGNESSGATEIGASGYDLTDVSMLKQQSSSVLGSGYFSVTDSVSDSMENTTDSDLQPGSGSYLILFVGAITGALAGSSRTICGDADASSPNEGIRMFYDSTADMNFSVDDSVEGVKTATISAVVTADTLMVAAGQIDRTNTQVAAYHNNDTRGTAGSLAASTIANPTQTFGVGDVAAGSGEDSLEFGILAVWKGSVAEGDWSTYISNLYGALGGG